MSAPDGKPAVTWSHGAAWRSLAASTLGTLLAVAVLNLLVNPFGFYGPQWLASEPGNTRRSKFELAVRVQPLPEAVILGSSRVMTMPPAAVTKQLGVACFNYGLSSAMVEDDYAALRLLVEDARMPIRYVILGLDFEALHPGLPVHAEAREFAQFSQYLAFPSPPPPRWLDVTARLISLEQTDESLKQLLHAGRRIRNLPAVQLQADGQAIQTARERAIAAGDFDLERIIAERVRRYPLRSLHLDSYREVDPLRLQHLDRLLLYCVERGIKVYAYITPLHPAEWRVLDALPESGILGGAYQEAAACCAARGIALRDFSRIESWNGDPNLFYDEMHLQPQNQERLLASLLTEPES